MSEPGLDVFDDVLLRRFYDPDSLARGEALADGDRARLLDSGPGSIRSVCCGSGHSTYLVTIQWVSRAGGIHLDDMCTCPLGGACKHCVATLVTARKRAGGAVTSTGGSPDWRQTLGELSADDDPAKVGLALQISLAIPDASRYQAGTEPRIAIRPLRRGKNGKWVKTGASWRDISSPYGYELSDVDPLQRAALKNVLAAGRTDPYYSIPPTLHLDQFGSDVWHQLERAVDIGVELVGGRPDAVVGLSLTRAEPTVDLTAGANGAVTMGAGFMLDGERLVVGGDADADGIGLIGSPPHGLWVIVAGRLKLVALSAPLHAAVARLVSAGHLTVPASDVEELLDVYQPELARHAMVDSSDRSVTITASQFEGIALLVERTALDRAVLHWWARYRRGEQTTDHSLSGPVGRRRDRGAELAAAASLELPVHLLPGLVDAAGAPQDLQVTGSDVVTLLSEVLPWLEAKGDVDVELTGGLPVLREATEDPLIALTVTDGGGDRAGNDWFDLGVEVSVEGEVVDFVTLFTALNQSEDVLILPSGTWLRLDRPEFKRLRELIDEARGLAEPTAAGVARLNRFQTGWWDELAGLGVVTDQSQRWADSVGQMAALTAPLPVAPPAGLEATLRPYQQEGLDWLAFLHRNRLGGILADDMGLGKTVQTLALCLHILQDDPDARFLVVAPTSVVENWARESARFTPDIEVRTIGETALRRGVPLDEAIDGAQLVVTSYALFRMEFDDYARHSWELLLLDEAQFVKNHQGKTYQCARRLDVTTKVAITGTRSRTA